ncbi:MAG: AraC family transcriptional regulator ligand-binding domain-containing protein [Myxococcales bacterium]
MFVSNLLVRSFSAESLHPLSDQVWLRHSQASFGPGLHGREVDELVTRMLDGSANPALGLALGEHGSMSMLHVVSHLMVTCRTLGDALSVLPEYAQLLLGGFDFQLEQAEDTSWFGFAPPSATEATARFWSDFMLAFTLRVTRLYMGPARSGVRELWLAHPQPEYSDEYTRMFGCPVRFDQPRYGFALPSECLAFLQPHADASLEAVLRAMARKQRNTLLDGDALLQGLRHALREEADLTEVDFERLARRLGTTKRVLCKRLALEGRSCGDLLDEARCQRALIDLQENIRIDEIAEKLGFSKRSSFHRAFKRWTGKTPNQYRGKRGPRRTRGQGVEKASA